MTTRSVFLLLGLLAMTACHMHRQQMRIVGSATVFPFVAAAAERFGEISGFPTPIVEAIGTGGGLALFCQSHGSGSAADFADASRRMTASEVSECQRHGVDHITEIPLGYDGIVLAEKRGNLPANITRKQLFLALAARVPLHGRIVANPYHRWREIDPALPDRPIMVYGPPPSSGTRDTLVELLASVGCADAAYAAITDAVERSSACHDLREDGGYIGGREDYNAIVLKLGLNPDAYGIFGYNFLAANGERIQAARIDGVPPSDAAIASGDYPLARLLYIYMKGENVGQIPGMQDFAGELLSDQAAGPEGYLTLAGLIPLPAADRETLRQQLGIVEKPHP